MAETAVANRNAPVRRRQPAAPGFPSDCKAHLFCAGSHTLRAHQHGRPHSSCCQDTRGTQTRELLILALPPILQKTLAKPLQAPIFPTAKREGQRDDSSSVLSWCPVQRCSMQVQFHLQTTDSLGKVGFIFMPLSNPQRNTAKPRNSKC